MVPGMWFMAMSPLVLALDQSVSATITWVVVLSLGEVFWSPRSSAWIASLAPAGVYFVCRQTCLLQRD